MAKKPNTPEQALAEELEQPDPAEPGIDESLFATEPSAGDPPAIEPEPPASQPPEPPTPAMAVLDPAPVREDPIDMIVATLEVMAVRDPVHSGAVRRLKARIAAWRATNA